MARSYSRGHQAPAGSFKHSPLSTSLFCFFLQNRFPEFLCRFWGVSGHGEPRGLDPWSSTSKDPGDNQKSQRDRRPQEQ